MNGIEGLVVNGRWSEDVETVKQEVHDHFHDQFKSRNYSRRILLDDLFSRKIG